MQIFCTIQVTVETNTFSFGILLVEFFLQRCHSSSISGDMTLSSTFGPSCDGLKNIKSRQGRPTPVRTNWRTKANYTTATQQYWWRDLKKNTDEDGTWKLQEDSFHDIHDRKNLYRQWVFRIAYLFLNLSTIPVIFKWIYNNKITLESLKMALFLNAIWVCW